MAKRGRTIDAETEVLPATGKGIEVVIDASACRTATMAIVAKVLPTAMERLLKTILKCAERGEYEYVVTKHELQTLGVADYHHHVVEEFTSRLFRTEIGKFNVGDQGRAQPQVGILVSWREVAQG